MQDSTVVARTVSQTLDVLAVKFGATGAHLWSVLIRQVYVNAIENVIQAIILVLVTRWMCKKIKSDDDIGWIIGAVAVGTFALIGCGIAIHSLAVMANPEYGALSAVLDAIKPSK